MVVTIWVTIFGICAIYAQVANPEEVGKTVKMEEVVITATRTPESSERLGSSVNVITGEQIEQQKANTILDVLRGMPGIYVSRTGTPGKTTSVFLRGSASKHTLIMLDGVQINSPTSGDFEWTNLSSDNIERIEIVRGPQSTLYGSDAMAGVINIFTKDSSAQPHYRFSAQGGSLMTFTERANASGSLNKLKYSFALSRDDSDGLESVNVPIYKKSGTEDAVADKYLEKSYGNDQANNTTLVGRLGYTFSERFEFQFVGRFNRGETGVPSQVVLDETGKLVRNFDQNANQLHTTNLGLIQGNASLFEWWKSRLKFSFAKEGLNYKDLPDPDEDATKAYSVSSEIDTNILTIDWQHTLTLDQFIPDNDIIQNSLVVGAEFEQQNATNFDVLQNKTQFDESLQNVAGYAEENIGLWNRLFLTLGGRFDNHSKFGTVITPRITSAYLLRETNTKLRASWGKGFRAPTFNELVYPNYGNQELEPEKSQSFDVGLEQSFFDKRINVGGTYFHMKFDNLIAAQLVNPETYKYQAANIEKAKSNGFELESMVQVINGLAVLGSYTFVSAQDTTTPGEAKPLRRRPRHSGRVIITYTPAFEPLSGKLNLNLDVVLVGKRYDNNPAKYGEAFWYPGYNKVDFAASYQILDMFQIYGKVSNLMAQDYQEVVGYPTQGINFFGGTKVSF
jgi:vitamin B12 transporter